MIKSNDIINNYRDSVMPRTLRKIQRKISELRISLSLATYCSSQTENTLIFQYVQLPRSARYLLYCYLSCNPIFFKLEFHVFSKSQYVIITFPFKEIQLHFYFEYNFFYLSTISSCSWTICASCWKMPPNSTIVDSMFCIVSALDCT